MGYDRQGKLRTIAVCDCGNESWDGLNFSRREDGTIECARCGGTGLLFVRASFTDEDVEDGARAMAAYDGDVCFEDDTGHRDAGRKHYRDYARCVLSTYLGEGK